MENYAAKDRCQILQMPHCSLGYGTEAEPGSGSKRHINQLCSTVIIQQESFSL
jgi:hypothetical protein